MRHHNNRSDPPSSPPKVEETAAISDLSASLEKQLIQHSPGYVSPPTAEVLILDEEVELNSTIISLDCEDDRATDLDKTITSDTYEGPVPCQVNTEDKQNSDETFETDRSQDPQNRPDKNCSTQIHQFIEERIIVAISHLIAEEIVAKAQADYMIYSDTLDQTLQHVDMPNQILKLKKSNSEEPSTSPKKPPIDHKCPTTKTEISKSNAYDHEEQPEEENHQISETEFKDDEEKSIKTDKMNESAKSPPIMAIVDSMNNSEQPAAEQVKITENTQLTNDRNEEKTCQQGETKEAKQPRARNLTTKMRENMEINKQKPGNIKNKRLSKKSEEIDATTMDSTRQLYCICKKEWEENKFYIGCDFCEDWFHGRCVGVTRDTVGIELFRCPKCKSANRNTPLSHSDFSLFSEGKKQNISETEYSKQKEDGEEKEKQESEVQIAKDQCNSWKENSKKLQVELNKKQKSIDQLTSENIQIKTHVTELKKSLTAKERDLTKSKEENKKEHEKFTSERNTAELLSKKFTKLQKENTLQSIDLKNGKETIKKLNSIP